MSLEFVVMVLFVLLLIAIFVIVYVVHDIRSGNYRKLLSAQDEHEQLKSQVKKVRNKNLGG